MKNLDSRRSCASRLPRPVLLLALALTFFAAQKAGGGGPFQFYAVSPCRIVDTRGPVGGNGGPALASGNARSFAVRGNCGIPPTAQAIAVNLTFVGPTQDGFLKVWPYGTTPPSTSNVNAPAGAAAIANGAIVPLAADPSLQVSVVYGTVQPGSAHVVLDVTGYFQ